MIALLLTLLVLPAHGARLHRCEAVLLLPVGEVSVPAWGIDEPTARERARRAAWLLAEYHGQPDRFLGQMVLPDHLAKRQIRVLGALDPAHGWEVPGYSVQPGECSSSALSSEKAEAWTARWPGDDKEAIRNDPSVAVEAIRRRTCFKGYQNRLGEAVLQSEKSEEPKRSHVLGVQLRDARDALMYCMTRSEPLVEAAGGGLPAPDRKGTFQCARPRRISYGWRAPHAYAEDLDVAREAALQKDLWTTAHQARADGWAATRVPADKRAAAVAAAWGPMRSLVVANDVAEQAMLLCNVGASKAVGAAWTPAQGLKALCPDLTADPISTTATPADLASTADRRCGAISRAGLSKASSAQGLSVAWTCANSCVADDSLLGWEPQAVIREGEIPHSSSDAAGKALGRAVNGRDFMAFGILTGGVVWQPEYAAVFKQDPTAFWTSIESAQKSGEWAQRAEWIQVDGHWILSFK